MVFAGQLVQEVKADAVDLVVDIQAAEFSLRQLRRREYVCLPFDILTVIFHDDIDEVVDSC